MAIRLSTCVYGGCFHPILTIDDDKQARLAADRFQLDVLFPSQPDPGIEAFIQDHFNHLKWPFINRHVTIETSREGPQLQVLDLLQGIFRIEDVRRRNLIAPNTQFGVLEWESSDPLANSLAASFGEFPSQSEVRRDYKRIFSQRLGAITLKVDVAAQIPQAGVTAMGPLEVGRYGLHVMHDRVRDRMPRGALWSWDSGLFAGSSTEWQDIVDFWNLRALGHKLHFVDVTWLERYRASAIEFLHWVGAEEMCPIWHGHHVDIEERRKAIQDVVGMPCYTRALSDRPIVTQSALIFGFGSRSATASVAEGRMSVSLLDKPYLDEHTYFFHQHAMVSVSAYRRDDKTRKSFSPPYLPALNEPISRIMVYQPWSVRTEPNGFGVIERVSASSVMARGIGYDEGIDLIFGHAGLSTRPSPSGLLARRLISQLGGLQGCRIFKLRGVRQLLREPATRAFTHPRARQAINDGLKELSDLHIEMGQRGHLTVPQVFGFLVRHGLVRAGLELKCPSCFLCEWYSLDQLGTDMRCGFCGEPFDPSEQLRDRHWNYRRSGLCDSDAVPVSLVLQQLDLVISGSLSEGVLLWAAGVETLREGEPKAFCELDVVLVVQERWGDCAVILGEVKGNDEISEDDVEHLEEVAERLDRVGVSTYLLFAKTGDFDDAERARIGLARDEERSNVILLGRDELEAPFFVFERPDIPPSMRYAHTAGDLARITEYLFLAPKADGLPSPESA
ncbi:MAG TPA: hypothetical protein VFS60_16595 [Thermoanaerobaculia bacterium]|nr:hypothetical protein [Thermoanaerobaculia bacterium]